MKSELPRTRPPVPEDMTPEQRNEIYRQQLRDLMAQGEPAVNGERRFFGWILDLFRPGHWRE